MLRIPDCLAARRFGTIKVGSSTRKRARVVPNFGPNSSPERPLGGMRFRATLAPQIGPLPSEHRIAPGRLPRTEAL